MTIGGRILGKPRTRADRIRARRARNQRKLEPLANIRKPQRRRRARRRYDLALPVEIGAEMRLPSMPTLRVGTRFLSLLLLIACAWALHRSFTDSAFVAAEAAVEGAQLLSPGQIRSIANVEARAIFWIDPRQAEQVLLSHPEIATAKVDVGWPNEVHIQVEERTPVVTWNDGGQSWWLSADGVAFLERGIWPGLVEIYSDEQVLDIQRDPLAHVIDPQVLLAASVLSAQLPEVGALRYDPIHGLGFDDPRGWRVAFGVEGDMVMKVRLYHTIADELAARGLSVGLISVENPAAPYYQETR